MDNKHLKGYIINQGNSKKQDKKILEDLTLAIKFCGWNNSSFRLRIIMVSIACLLTDQ